MSFLFKSAQLTQRALFARLSAELSEAGTDPKFKRASASGVSFWYDPAQSQSSSEDGAQAFRAISLDGTLGWFVCNDHPATAFFSTAATAKDALTDPAPASIFRWFGYFEPARHGAHSDYEHMC